MGKANSNVPRAVMSPLQAAAALKLAGWPDDQLVTGVAVGEGESGLDASVENEIGAAGWLQVLRSAHPDLFSALPSKSAWMDPVTDAKMALSVYNQAGHSWRPWQAYTNGAYSDHLADAQKAVSQLQHDTAGLNSSQLHDYYLKLWEPIYGKLIAAQMATGEQAVVDGLAGAAGTAGQTVQDTGNAVVDSIGSVVKELTSFSDFFQALLLPGTWLRVGSGLVGVLLVIGGLVALGKEASTGG